MKYICTFRLVLRCLLVTRKENLTGVSIGLTGRSKNLDLTGNPTGRSNQPVSISAEHYPDGMGSGFNPHHGRVVASLEKTLYDDSIKSTGTLDHRKLLSRRGFLQRRRSHCN